MSKMVFRKEGTRQAFTLIELLVVVAIIALLISILLPALGRARSEAKNSVCRSNLHQLALATTYYADENQNRLPAIRCNLDSQGRQFSRRQYDQIFDMWPYLKDLKIYKCPSAFEDNSVKSLPEDDPGYTGTCYTVKKDDILYRKSKYWWPDIDPTSYSGTLIPPLYSEYFYNDWYQGATNPITGEPIAQIAGGVISKIPVPNRAVVIADGIYDTFHPRHGDGNNFAFLDAHVEKLPKKRYYDTVGPRPVKDYDDFGNRPFYAWGLTRQGFDALPSEPSPR